VCGNVTVCIFGVSVTRQFYEFKQLGMLDVTQGLLGWRVMRAKRLGSSFLERYDCALYLEVKMERL
jgi:hypothetical protein